MKTSQQISDFLDFVSQAEKDYNYAISRVKYYDAQNIDNFHKLRDCKCKRDANKITWDVATDQKIRGEYKDIAAELLPVVKFLEEHRKAIERLKQTLGEIRKQEDYHKSDRKYYSRVEAYYGRKEIK